MFCHSSFILHSTQKKMHIPWKIKIQMKFFHMNNNILMNFIVILEFHWHQRCHLILVFLLVEFSQKLQKCFLTHRRKHLSNIVKSVILKERISDLCVSSFLMCYRQMECPTLLTLCFNYVFCF